MTVRFTLGGMFFEYDSEKNRKNIEKHGISFKSAARVFFDYDRIELYDETRSGEEDRYDRRYLRREFDDYWEFTGCLQGRRYSVCGVYGESGY